MVWKTNPLLAAILTGSLCQWLVFLFFLGFFAKLFLFDEMIQSGSLVIIAVINSIISVGYYFKLVAMYNKESNEERTGTPFVIYAVAIVALV
jgi:NADH-quinone oxidoreductase subunit N